MSKYIKKPKIEKECIICGTTFLTSNFKYLVCSKECAKIHYRNNSKRLYYEKYKIEKGYGERKSGIIKKCLVCNKEFYVSKGLKDKRKYCSVGCSSKDKRIIKPFSEEHKQKISKNHHNVSGSNNPNWKGGISLEKTKHRNKTWKLYKIWRDSVLERDNYKCKNCGSDKDLHAHHIIARKTLPDAEFIRANGVTLCAKCHRETDSWGGGKDITSYNRKGSMLKFIMKVIPHHWHDYPTVGNYFYTKNGTFVIFCSDLKNDNLHLLIFSHEMVEASIALSRGISLSKIDKFDKRFEEEGKEGEPGDDAESPYKKEHRFSENIERLIAHELNIDFNSYSNILDALFNSNNEIIVMNNKTIDKYLN